MLCSHQSLHGQRSSRLARRIASPTMKKYYPVFLEAEGRKCVIVGGGGVAARKAKSLADVGAKVKVISPSFCQALLRLAETGRAVLVRRRFRKGDLAGAFLTIACTDDGNVNKRVYGVGREKRVLVNVVDAPDLCDFIVPSVVVRGSLRIAVSTSGVSPALARRIREELEERYGQGHADFLERMEKARRRIIRDVSKAVDRRRIFETLASEEFLNEFMAAKRSERRRLFERKLKEMLAAVDRNHV